MRIVFRPHAVDRMLLRGLSAEELESTVKEPDGKIKQSKDKTIFYKALRERSDNLVAAVAVKVDEGFEVLTVLVNFEVRHDA